jgi:hypothetical protein
MPPQLERLMSASREPTIFLRPKTPAWRRSLFLATLASVALLILLAGGIAYLTADKVSERISAPFLRVSN